MIPNHKERNVQTSGLDEQAVFGIAADQQAHIMTILRDTLYTDKILAVLREYGANAWDSHRMNGKDNVPIKVTLPSPTEPTLAIRDFGPGLSQEEVFTVFTQYGASTKRTTDKAVGTLGIGCKSGFAYSDSFSIDSYNNGTKSTYVAVLDKSEKGMITLLNREPCGEETGLCIQIPVRPEDIPTFIDKAKGLFRYFVPKPDINTELADMADVSMQMKAGAITRAGGWVAVMGCIPYRINIDQLQALRSKEDDAISIRRFLNGLSGILFFRIGEIHIVANREELRYTTETKNVLVARFNELIEEYVSSALKDIEDSGLTLFERRIRLMKFDDLKFAIPEVLKEFLNPTIDVKESKDFAFCRMDYHKGKQIVGDSVDYFDAHEDTELIIKDDSRAFEGFSLTGRPWIVKLKTSPNKKPKTWEEMMPKFEKFLEHHKISGISVKKLSELPWSEPPKKDRKKYEVNEKHKVSVFKFDPEAYGRGSELWKAVQHKPDANDVFVVLEKFKTYRPHQFDPTRKKVYNFREKYNEVKSWLEFFGEKMPVVRGYKTTEKRPVKKKDLLGTEFLVWAEAKKKELTASAETNPTILGMVEMVAWDDLTREIYTDTHYNRVASAERVKGLINALGQNHPLVSVLEPFSEAEIKRRESYSGFSSMENFVNSNTTLCKMKEKVHKALQKKLKKTIAMYPLLKSVQGGLSNLLRDSYMHWVPYVKLIDKEKADGKRTEVHDDERVNHAGVGGEDAHGPELAAELREPVAGPLSEGLGQHPQVPDGQQGALGVGAG
jgi:hypothetical protein